MSQVEKQCIIDIFRGRYANGVKKQKGQILDEVCERLGVGRRQARRLLERKLPGRPKKSETRGRPSKYGNPEFVRALRGLWRSTRYMCSRHLKSAIPDWIVYVKKEQGPYVPEIRTLLLSVSAPTIDRILKPWKACKEKSLANNGGFRDQTPIQESVWNIEMPGYLEADTVAHCGGSTMGEYVTLTMVDIATTWTETRAVFGKGSTPIVHAIEDIEQQLPFRIHGYDCDNGTEVLNSHVLRYFRDERIERGRTPVHFTRSREYKKNDNPKFGSCGPENGASG